MSKILRHIDIDLTPASINHAIREIELFRKQLEEQLSDLVKLLVDEGTEIAKMQVVSMNAVFTGALEQSIRGVFYKNRSCGVIFSDVPHAIYVEYGTGYNGAGGGESDISGGWDTYPGDLPPGYKPDATGHGSAGWWYPAPWGWYIPKGSNTKLAWTRGMPSRPFLYNTLRWLEEAAPERASNMFSQM